MYLLGLRMRKERKGRRERRELVTTWGEEETLLRTVQSNSDNRDRFGSSSSLFSIIRV